MTQTARPTPVSWAFRSRFRRGAFGWKGSRLAIDRISEALTEIRAVARQDPAAAAEGAVAFLEKLSPALCQVDSSSGALGNATYSAVQELTPLIAQAPVEFKVRSQWLDRLFDAYQEDDPPYIESLGDAWGELCGAAELASEWADRLLPTLRSVLRERGKGTFAFFAGTTICYSALYKAGRHDELLDLLALDAKPIWPYLIWGGRVLADRGQVDEAIAYMHERVGRNHSEEALARFAEEQLLRVGRRAEAFERYALQANQTNSHLATFRALAKKYPELDPERLLSYLVESSPEQPGKWFATAKTLKRFDLAIRLAWASPCDPKTLTRAARDHLISQPAFAMQCSLAALHWISIGHGYELTSADVQGAHRLAIEAGEAAQQPEQAKQGIEKVLAAEGPQVRWIKQSLGLEPWPATTRRR